VDSITLSYLLSVIIGTERHIATSLACACVVSESYGCVSKRKLKHGEIEKFIRRRYVRSSG
jgi:hypothetical protein